MSRYASFAGSPSRTGGIRQARALKEPFGGKLPAEATVWKIVPDVLDDGELGVKIAIAAPREQVNEVGEIFARVA